jgi:sulfide dehydrogenase cytochrome subunit
MAQAGIHWAPLSEAGTWVPAFPVTALLLLLAVTTRAAEMPPPGASSCSGCHPASRAVQTPVAILQGRPASDLLAAMQNFRSGARPATVMNRIAKGFSDDEIAAIAAWYAAQPAPGR